MFMPNKYNSRRNVKLIICSIILISIVTIFVRSVGGLQLLELVFLDGYFKIRPQQQKEDRILIVGYGESDIQKLGSPPMSDWTLADLLERIKKQNPAAIGLDIYRDKPVGHGYERLVKVFKSTPNLTGVTKVVANKYSVDILPPPVLKNLKQISSVDMVTDTDNVVRRGVLLLEYKKQKQEITSLGLDVALKYLRRYKIYADFATNKYLKLGQTTFVGFKENDGGYVAADSGGDQILINYRGLPGSFSTVSVADILENRVPVNLIRDRIVLIGATAPSLNDLFVTPYGSYLANPIYTSGVEIQANIASQIISSVLDKRPLIKTWSKLEENLWICFWSGIAAVFTLACSRQNEIKSSIKYQITIFLVLLISIFFILTIGFLSFLLGWWIPVVPALVALVSSVYVTDKFVCSERVNQKLAAVWSASPAGLWEFNLITHQVTIKGNCKQLLGLETEIFTTSWELFLEFIERSDREKLIKLSKSTNTTYYELELRAISSGGSEQWLHLQGKCFYNSRNLIKLVGSIINVSEIKQKELAVENTEKRQHFLLQNSFDVFLTIAEDLSIISASPSIQRVFGYEQGEVIGVNFSNFIHPEDLDIFLSSLEECLTVPAKKASITYRYCNKQQEWRVVDSIICLEESIIDGFLLILHDATTLDSLHKLLLFPR